MRKRASSLYFEDFGLFPQFLVRKGLFSLTNKTGKPLRRIKFVSLISEERVFRVFDELWLWGAKGPTGPEKNRSNEKVAKKYHFLCFCHFFTYFMLLSRCLIGSTRRVTFSLLFRYFEFFGMSGPVGSFAPHKYTWWTFWIFFFFFLLGEAEGSLRRLDRGGWIFCWKSQERGAFSSRGGAKGPEACLQRNWGIFWGGGGG